MLVGGCTFLLQKMIGKTHPLSEAAALAISTSFAITAKAVPRQSRNPQKKSQLFNTKGYSSFLSAPSRSLSLSSLQSQIPSSILLNRRRSLPLPRRAARTSARPLGLLRHAGLAVQLLVGVDHVCFFGRHFLAVDHAEAGSCWDIEGALGGEGGGGAAGYARC